LEGSPKFKINDTVRTGKYSGCVKYKVINVFWYETTDRTKLHSQYRYTCCAIDEPEQICHFFDYQIEDATILSDEEMFNSKFSGKTVSFVDIEPDTITISMTDGSIMNFICRGDDVSYIEFYDENGK